MKKKIAFKRSKTTGVIVSFRCPEDIYALAMKRAASEDSDFSKLCRRAIRREIFTNRSAN